MPDVRIPSGSQALTPIQPAGRAEAVKAAQRAFFNAALTATQASAPVRPQRTEIFAAAASAPQRLSPTMDAAPTDRILRPGSLLDIKV